MRTGATCCCVPSSATFFSSWGDLESARRSLTEGLQRSRSILGDERQEVGEVAGFLAEAYLRLGDLEAADGALRLAEAAAQRWRGARRWRLGRMEYRRAEWWLLRGQPAEAEPRVRRAIATLEASDAALHHRAQAVSLLGEVLMASSRWAEAESALETALHLHQQALGEHHARTTASLALLAECRLRRGHASSVPAMAVEVEARRFRLLDLAIAAFSERQVLHLLRRTASGRDLAVASAVRTAQPEHVRIAWDLVVRSRLRSLERLAARSRESAAVSRVGADDTLEQLGHLRRRMAAQALQAAGRTGDDQESERLMSLSARRDALERQLARRIGADPNARSDLDSQAAEILAALPRQTTLVSYVRLGWSEGDRYVAFVSRSSDVLRASEVDEPFPAIPKLIDLGAATAIDGAISRWQRLVRRASAGLQSPHHLESMQRQAGSAVRELIWDEVAPFIEGSTQVLIVAEGDLHRVSWSALPIASGYLVESAPTIHVLDAERSLLEPAPPMMEEAMGSGQQTGRPGRLLALGDAAFQQPLHRPSQDSSFRGFPPADDCAWPPTAGFEPLPGSKREVEDVVRLWRDAGGTAEVFVGPDATREALQERAHVADAIHLATHAFFIPPACRSRLLQTRADSPLLLSGLVLSSDETDTAHALSVAVSSAELAGLELRAEWAVLSGCETGLGDSMGADGMLGLRTALRQAGVRTLVISLWPVPDDQTQAWLRWFYQRRLAGAGLAEAARHASLERLRELRALQQAPLPALWAPFVTVGAWR